VPARVLQKNKRIKAGGEREEIQLMKFSFKIQTIVGLSKFAI